MKVYNKDIKTLTHRQEYLAKLIDEGKANSYDKQEHQTLTRVIETLRKEKENYETERTVFGEL